MNKFYGTINASLIVGLPLNATIGPDAHAIKTAIKEDLAGHHEWGVDGEARSSDFNPVLVASQPVGALYDWLLTSDGKYQPDRRDLSKAEIGVIGLGMNTVDLLVVENTTPVERFTGGYQSGVRRLLELANPSGLYTTAEMDARLRSGSLDLSRALPVWENEIKGLIDQQWGKAAQRFAAVISVGGGAVLLGPALQRRFGARAQFADDLVLSTARGLYKFGVLKKMSNVIAFDAGFGAVKVYSAAGQVVMPAAVSSNGQTAVGDLVGLGKSVRPMHIEHEGGSFYVGANAHKFGRPVQSMDLDRLIGPEMRALLYGALSK